MNKIAPKQKNTLMEMLASVCNAKIVSVIAHEGTQACGGKKTINKKQ